MFDGDVFLARLADAVQHVGEILLALSIANIMFS